MPTFPSKTCRKRPSKALKQAILDAQNHACRACGKPLADVEYDHIQALGLGGDNRPENWAALCPRCHKIKTAGELKAMAKADRQRRYHETGRSRAPAAKPGMRYPASTFDREWRKHMDGSVTRRCECARCRPRKAPR
jgi:5-methylcytosine-specific restriction endonuclease McrA